MYQLGKFTIIVLIAVIHFEVVEDRLMEIESKTAKIQHEHSSTDVSSDDKIKLQNTDSNSILLTETKTNTAFEEKEDSFFFLEKITEAYMKRENYSLRKTRSIDNKTTKFSEQFEKICNSSGSQPCTCYYPDHRSIPQFEISADDLSKTASGVNGTGPVNCQDLRNLSYNLRGFYMVRFNSQRIKAIFCEFNNETLSTSKNQVENNEKNHTQRGNDLYERDSPKIRFCGGVGSKLCTYLYSDYPDAPHVGEMLTGKNRKEPTSCEDLKIIGHYLKGFYFVWLSSIKVKIVYCDFSNESMEGNKTIITQFPSNSTHTESSLFCNGLGSQPCSCYFPTSPNMLQFELGNDETTRKVLSTGNGPSSCIDLQSIGYALNGFYLVRFSKKIIKTVFCEFNQTGTNTDLGQLAWQTKGDTTKMLELKKEMTQLPNLVKDLGSSQSYTGTSYTNTFICFAVQKLAALPSSSQSAGSSVVKFEEEIINFGDSFNLNESVFIAPKEGIYEFIFNGYKRGNNKEHVLKVSLRLNGKAVANSLAEELAGDHPVGPSPVHNYRCPISMHSLLKLKKGDRVDVITSQGNLHQHDLNFPIHFSGKLLYNQEVENPKQNLSTTVYCILKKSAGFNTSKSVIPFEVESLNVGGAFDMKKNAFIAPVSGIYEFTFKGYKNVTNENTFISLRLNGKVMAASWSDKIDFHDHHTPFSIISILNLKQGDIIDLHLKWGHIYDDDNQYTTFTGKLLLMHHWPPESNFNITTATFHSLAVFFYVQGTRTFDQRSKGVPFEKMVLNVGEAFNMTENTFAAPSAGIYEFSFVGLKKTFDFELLFISLRLNGNAATNASADANESHSFRTPVYFHSILKMKKGDRVDIFLEKGGLYGINIDPYNHFTGKLLFTVGNENEMD